MSVDFFRGFAAKRDGDELGGEVVERAGFRLAHPPLDLGELGTERTFGFPSCPAVSLPAKRFLDLASIGVAVLHSPHDSTSAFIAKDTGAARHR